MAIYEATTRTNYFKVTDENKYQELFNNLTSEANIHDFTKKINGELYHSFGSYATIDYYTEDKEFDFDVFLNKLQKILPDNEAFVLIEVGYEKLRYITGYSLILTSKVCEQIDLGINTTKRVKELLGEDYELRISY